MEKIKAIAKRFMMTAVYHGLRVIWRISGTRGSGVQALVVTATGKIVLVRHSYMAGWHFPGGGLKRNETPERGIIRELVEEIGLLCWADVGPSNEPQDSPAPGLGTTALFIVTGAEYRFRPSIEIERAAEFAPEALPQDCSFSARRHVARWQAGKALQGIGR